MSIKNIIDANLPGIYKEQKLPYQNETTAALTQIMGYAFGRNFRREKKPIVHDSWYVETNEDDNNYIITLSNNGNYYPDGTRGCRYLINKDAMRSGEVDSFYWLTLKIGWYIEEVADDIIKTKKEHTKYLCGNKQLEETSWIGTLLYRISPEERERILKFFETDTEFLKENLGHCAYYERKVYDDEGYTIESLKPASELEYVFKKYPMYSPKTDKEPNHISLIVKENKAFIKCLCGEESVGLNFFLLIYPELDLDQITQKIQILRENGVDLSSIPEELIPINKGQK